MDTVQPEQTIEQAPVIPEASAQPETISLSEPQANSWLDSVPQQYKEAGWVNKYKSADDFFKGVENLNKMISQKQIVQGLEVPGQDAPEEKWEEFYSKLRPESADKYEFDPIEMPEGIDFNAEKEAFSQLAHKAGLTSKQAKTLFNEYAKVTSERVNQSTEKFVADAQTALKEAFGENHAEGLALAKKGAKALGIADKLDQAGLSTNPLVLKIVSELGKLTGEDNLIQPGDGSTGVNPLEEAKRLQLSPEYLAGDKATHQKVAELYKKVYG